MQTQGLLTICDVTDLVLIHVGAGWSEAIPTLTHVASVESRSVGCLQVHTLLGTVVSPRCALVNICSMDCLDYKLETVLLIFFQTK